MLLTVPSIKPKQSVSGGDDCLSISVQLVRLKKGIQVPVL